MTWPPKKWPQTKIVVAIEKPFWREAVISSIRAKAAALKPTARSRFKSSSSAESSRGLVTPRQPKQIRRSLN